MCTIDDKSVKFLRSLNELMDTCMNTELGAKESIAEPYRLRIRAFMQNSQLLFQRDYKYFIVHNVNGALCGHYPENIVILENSLSDIHNARRQPVCEVDKLKQLFHNSRLARCRQRFVVPVILYNGHYICRGATLASGKEMHGVAAGELILKGVPVPEASAQQSSNSDLMLYDRLRGHDIILLKELKVTCICDLMVENKKVKFALNVTSSEKVDKLNRYADFVIGSVPYPGCEFFREWRDNNYVADDLIFNWSQSFVDAELHLPSEFLRPESIDWSQYKSWDLTTLTKSYLKLFLYRIATAESGTLIHCISGWDRTPMFISLIRLSLWADGSIHESLSAAEILYLTVAYDWFLFGHSFKDRRAKGQEIFYFCFKFLSEIVSDEFVFKKSWQVVPPSGTSPYEHLRSLDDSPESTTRVQDHSPEGATRVPDQSPEAGRSGLDLSDFSISGDSDVTPSKRQQRLESVQCLFLRNFSVQTELSAGILAELAGNVAEKLGFK